MIIISHQKEKETKQLISQFIGVCKENLTRNDGIEVDWGKEYHKGYMARLKKEPFDDEESYDWKHGWECANMELKYSAMSMLR